MSTPNWCKQVNETMRLEKKCALITGGAQGIGYAIAQTYCREGAVVYLADVDRDAGMTAESDLKANGCNASYVFLDVSDDGNWKQVVDQVAEEAPPPIDPLTIILLLSHTTSSNPASTVGGVFI